MPVTRDHTTGDSPPHRRRQIGLLHPRLVATIALLPLTGGVLIIEAFICDWLRIDPDRPLTVLIFMTPMVCFNAGLLLIWWRTIKWTASRRLKVAAILLGLLALYTPAAAYLLMANDDDVGILLCLSVSFTGGAVAMVLISAVCWTPPGNPITPRPVPCPQCGHDLRGQRSCRCGACGYQATLAELAASKAVADALGLDTDALTAQSAKTIGIT